MELPVALKRDEAEDHRVCPRAAGSPQNLWLHGCAAPCAGSGELLPLVVGRRSASVVGKMDLGISTEGTRGRHEWDVEEDDRQ